MLRILIVIALILIAIPLFNSAKDYVGEKTTKATIVGHALSGFFHFKK
jgi:uncharacterized protein involved in outer membrane biogenesis